MGICRCKEGGYCVVHNRVSIGEEREMSDQYVSELDKIKKDTWNAAIEAAAKIANNWNLYCEEEIRKLKK